MPKRKLSNGKAIPSEEREAKRVRAGKMPKRELTGSERVKLALASFSNDVVIADFCTKHGISRSTLYRLRKALVDYLSERL